MKLAIIALVLAVSLAQTEAWWGYGKRNSNFLDS